MMSPPRHHPSAIVIRPLIEADLPTLEWDGEYTHYRLAFREMWNDMQRNQRWLLGAFDGRLMAGQIFVQFWSSDARYADGDKRGYVYALRVKPAWRGQGLGTQLIYAAEAVLRERQFNRVSIAVAKDNLGALRLYQRLGYSTFAEDPGVWYFTDVNGIARHMEEPCWVLEKRL